MVTCAQVRGAAADVVNPDYSLRSASTGLIRAARQAGRKPDTLLVAITKASASRITDGDSGNTILIVEDGSSSIPVTAYILVQRIHANTWTWSELSLPEMPPDRQHPVYHYSPDVLAITDKGAWLAPNAHPFPKSFSKCVTCTELCVTSEGYKCLRARTACVGCHRE